LYVQLGLRATTLERWRCHSPPSEEVREHKQSAHSTTEQLSFLF
jgi:hypothetical protein